MKAYNKALVQFMEKKAAWMQEELTIPAEWYFNEGDREDIMSWDEKEAQEVWGKIKYNVLHNKCSGLRYEFCPFCHKYEYKHEGCGRATNNPSCLLCGYGKRHGICADHTEGASQYRQILRTFEKDRIDIYRFFSNAYYESLVGELEKMIKQSDLQPLGEH